MRILIALFAIGIVAMGAAFVVAEMKTPATSPAAALTAAPNFTLNDQDNKPVSLADFKGKTVVLEWTNPQCPFVQRHYKAGTMVNLAAKYKDKGVVWLAINTTKTASVETNKKWATDQKIEYSILDDHDGVVGKGYGAKSTPDMFVIDAKGNIAYQGAIDDNPDGTKAAPVNYVDQALTQLLAGKPVSTPSTTPYGCTVKFKD